MRNGKDYRAWRISRAQAIILYREFTGFVIYVAEITALRGFAVVLGEGYIRMIFAMMGGIDIGMVKCTVLVLPCQSSTCSKRNSIY